jgi:hypothetical protein
MQIRKFLPIECDVIVVDGMWGVGKTAVTSVIGTMKHVEKMKLQHVHEYVCTMHHLGKLSDDALRFLLLTYVDIDQYSNLIGREVNFRPSDASGTKNTPGSTVKYLRRMFAQDGDAIIDRIHQDRIAHQLVTHQILPVGEPVFSTFGDRLKMVHIVRHPMHLARYYHDYLVDWMRHREFTVSFDLRGEKVPWWASEWAERFLALNTMDRTLESLSFLYHRIFEQIERRRDDSRLLVLSFENVVMRPHESFPAISSFLGRELDKKTSKILTREKIPRPTITHGRAFSAHNWATSGAVSERDVYELEVSYIRASASADVVERFRGVVDTYNRLWPSELNEFATLL